MAVIGQIRDLASRFWGELDALGLAAGFLHIVRILLLLTSLPTLALNSLFGSSQWSFLMLLVTIATIVSYKRPKALWFALFVMAVAIVTDPFTRP